LVSAQQTGRLIGLFWPLTFAQSHTRAAAVPVDELDTVFFPPKNDPLLIVYTDRVFALQITH
jgi:hypothetical protein